MTESPLAPQTFAQPNAAPQRWRSVAWTVSGGTLPFVLFAVFNVALGNIEPLVGGALENLIVMVGMGCFYAVFVMGPFLFLGWRAPSFPPGPTDALFGALAGALMLLCVELLPLNAWGVARLGATFVVSGAGCAGLAHGMRRVLAARTSQAPAAPLVDGRDANGRIYAEVGHVSIERHGVHREESTTRRSRPRGRPFLQSHREPRRRERRHGHGCGRCAEILQQESQEREGSGSKRASSAT